MWRALAILISAAIALPVFDIYALKAAGLPVTNVHPITLAALTVVAGLLWVREMRGEPSLIDLSRRDKT